MQLKGIIPSGKFTRLTLVWSLIQAISISVLEIFIVRFHIVQNKNHKEVDENDNSYIYVNNGVALTVYELLFIVAQAYQFVIAVDTVLNFSTIQLIALAFFNTSCLAYAVVQFYQASEINKNLITIIDERYKFENIVIFEYIIIGLMVLFVIGWWYITFRLYKIFGWSVFKQLGADIKLKRRLKLYQILLTLLKLDIFFFATFVIQYFVFIIMLYKNKNIIDLSLLVITILAVIIGYIATIKISRKLISLFLFLLSASIGYMSSILVDIYTTYDGTKYSNSRNSLSYTIGGGIAIGLLTFIMSLINFKNFGIGIPKTSKKNYEKTTSQSGTSEKSDHKRWSIE